MDDRYLRQIDIPQIGSEGQKKLSNASVLVVGAGGLGSPVLTYLAAAGVGRLGIVDSDIVTLSNLNRQFLHNTSDIGRTKTDSAAEKLLNFNNQIKVNKYNVRLTEKNVKDIFTGNDLHSYDVIIGAVDSFETRFVINKTCVTLGIPYIDGGINGFSGCVMFSNPPDTPCLNCVFPEKLKKDAAVNSLGTTAGVIGSIEANIVLLFLLGLPIPIKNKLLFYDGLRLCFDHVDVKRNERCAVCGGKTL